MTNTLSNRQDVIDSRDVIARIAELEQEREMLQDDLDEAQKAHDEAVEAAELEEIDELRDKLEAAKASVAEWDASEEGQELKALQALAEEASSYAPDWKYGEALIRDSYFTEYAQELAEDIGAINKDASWPNDCIDWEKAADQLKMDYTEVDFDGVSYWIRS